MTLDRPGEGAMMLRTFTLFLFCMREYKEVGGGAVARDPLRGASVSGCLGKGVTHIEVRGWVGTRWGLSFTIMSLFRAESGYDTNR